MGRNHGTDDPGFPESFFEWDMAGIARWTILCLCQLGQQCTGVEYHHRPQGVGLSGAYCPSPGPGVVLRQPAYRLCKRGWNAASMGCDNWPWRLDLSWLSLCAVTDMVTG